MTVKKHNFTNQKLGQLNGTVSGKFNSMIYSNKKAKCPCRLGKNLTKNAMKMSGVNSVRVKL